MFFPLPEKPSLAAPGISGETSAASMERPPCSRHGWLFRVFFWGSPGVCAIGSAHPKAVLKSQNKPFSPFFQILMLLFLQPPMIPPWLSLTPPNHLQHTAPAPRPLERPSSGVRCPSGVWPRHPAPHAPSAGHCALRPCFLYELWVLWGLLLIRRNGC